MRYPAAGPDPACRWCGHAVGPVEVAHRACVEDVLARLKAPRGRGWQPVPVGAVLAGGAR